MTTENSKDISLGGLRFVSRQDISPGILISLDLFTPTQSQPFHIVGRVTWRKRGIVTRNYEIGLEFVKIDDDGKFKSLLEMLEEVKLEEVVETDQSA